MFSTFTQIAFGGDQLRVERSRSAQARRVTSDDPVDALQGLEPFAADWHAEANFLQGSLQLALIVVLCSTCTDPLMLILSFPRSSLSVSILVAQTVMVEPCCSCTISSIAEKLIFY